MVNSRFLYLILTILLFGSVSTRPSTEQPRYSDLERLTKQLSEIEKAAINTELSGRTRKSRKPKPSDADQLEASSSKRRKPNNADELTPEEKLEIKKSMENRPRRRNLIADQLPKEELKIIEYRPRENADQPTPSTEASSSKRRNPKPPITSNADQLTQDKTNEITGNGVDNKGDERQNRNYWSIVLEGPQN